MPPLAPTGWLCVDGVELINHYRTETYLRRGLAGPSYRVYTRDDPYPNGATYIDVFGNPHTVDAFSPVNLRDWCEQGGDPAGYVSPAADPAPWYSASRPESGQFLGAMLTSLDVRPSTRRLVVQLAGGGGSIGRKIPAHRAAAADCLLIASTAAGMEYGRRWFADVLAGGLCGDTSGEIVYLQACPADPTVDTGYRRLARAHLIDGPIWESVGNVGDCRITRAQWQWAAGVPYLLSEPEVVGTQTTLATGQTGSFQVTTGEWVGDTAVFIRLSAPDSPSGVHGIDVKAYPVPDGGTCPQPGTPNPCHAWSVPALAPLGVIEVDSATEQAIYYDPTAKDEAAAWPQLSFAGPWDWLTVPACSTVCVQVTHTGSGPPLVVDVLAVKREA